MPTQKFTIVTDRPVASFDVDAQKGFTTLCPDELPVPDGHLIVDELNKLSNLADFRIGSKDAHNTSALHIADKKNPQFSPIEGEPFLDIRWNAHCIMGTKGAELLDGLPHWSEYEYFVWKGMEPDTHPYSAVYHTPRSDKIDRLSTGVIEFLRQRNVDYVLVNGLALDYCVKETVLDLREAGFRVVVNLAGSPGISMNTIDEALKEMGDAGVLFIDSADDLTIDRVGDRDVQ
jgi:nicotinamidase/pyrazinamidase